MLGARTFPTAAAAALMTSNLGRVSPALATPGSGFTPAPIVNGHFKTLNVNTSKDKTDKWGLGLKTLDDTRHRRRPADGSAAGGFSGWHAHPAPAFVTVPQGGIVGFDGSDPLCTGNAYSAGQSFIEDAYVAHNVTSAGGAEFVAIVIKPAGFEDPGAPALNRDKPK